MSSEFDLSTDLETIQARMNGTFDMLHEILAPSQCATPIPSENLEKQLKEQTHQMKEMASMMKSMMQLAMPLLEEKADTLRREKAEKADTLRRKMEADERRGQAQWTSEGPRCTVSNCHCVLEPCNTNGGHVMDNMWGGNNIVCPRHRPFGRPGYIYRIKHQRPKTKLEVSYIIAYLQQHINKQLHRLLIDDYEWIWNNTNFVMVRCHHSSKKISPTSSDK